MEVSGHLCVVTVTLGLCVMIHDSVEPGPSWFKHECAFDGFTDLSNSTEMSK